MRSVYRARNSNYSFFSFYRIGASRRSCWIQYPTKPSKFFNFKKPVTKPRERRQQSWTRRANALDPSTASGISPRKKALISTTQTILLTLFSIWVIFNQGVILPPPRGRDVWQCLQNFQMSQLGDGAEVLLSSRG